MTLTENMLCAKTHEYVVEVEKGTYQISKSSKRNLYANLWKSY